MLGVYVGNAPTPPKVFVNPPVVKDTTIRPDAPSQNSYPNTHLASAIVVNPENAYDKNQQTFALVNITANPSLYPPSYYFDVLTFNSSTFLQPYSALEIKMNYSYPSPISSCSYRILLYVGSASIILQDWISRLRSTPSVWTWTGVPEPNDGDWSQDDLSNMRISVETKKTTSSGKGTVKIYEIWASILHDSFKVKIDVSDVSNLESLFGWQINMTFNPEVVFTTAESIPFTTSVFIWEGPFLKQAGSTSFTIVDVNNTAGYLMVGDLLFPAPEQGVSGSGTLMYITFKVRAVGRGTLLQFVEGTKLNTVISGNLVPIEHTTEDGVFDNNVPPIANFNVEPSVANVNDTINFDASASYDPDAWLQSYRWDFGDGTTQLFNNLTAQTTHFYTRGGLYTVTLTVTDNGGATASAKADVTIKGHDVAVTNVKSIYITAMQGILVPINVTVANRGDFTETFNVTTYFNETVIENRRVTDMPPHTEKPLTVTWNTTNVGFGKYVLKANATIVEKDYDPSNNKYIDGTVAVALTNTVDYPVVIGGFTFHVVVESNSTPSNSLQFNQAEKKISFNVEGKNGTHGFCNVTIPVDLLGGPYKVFFDDSLISPEPQETTNGTHTSLYFTYTHSLHNVQIIGQTVAIPPVAIFTSSTTRAIAHTQVTFNATDSYARVLYGTIQGYRWDFGDDNTTTWLTNPIITHAYTTAGNYTVTLTVKDNKQLTNSTQAQITVIDYPTADFSYSPKTPLVGETVTFNASTSEPNGGSIISYQWDFGDGSTDHDITVTHAYSSVGNYVVVLNVTDDEGLWDTENRTLTVSIHNIAITDLTATPNTVKIGQQISISITVANKGNFTETFSVTAYYEDTPIETKPVTKLASGAFWTISIAWNTTGVNPGTYTLKAIATFVTGETKKDDNTFIGGTVTINKMDSQLTISASLTTLTLGETTTISGAISPVRPNVNITIQYRLIDGAWNNLPSVTTDADGHYTCNWKPERAGTYEVKASWQGDANTLPSESEKKQITVNEPTTPINFLYVVIVSVFILSAALAVYFLKIKKPKVKE